MKSLQNLGTPVMEHQDLFPYTEHDTLHRIQNSYFDAENLFILLKYWHIFFIDSPL